MSTDFAPAPPAAAPPPDDPPGPLRTRLLSTGSSPTAGFRIGALVLAAILAVLVIVPLGLVIVQEIFGAQVSPFVQIWEDGRLVRVMRTTLLVVLGSTVLATAIGAGFAWLNERTDASLGKASSILPIIPLLVPPLAGAIGWILLASTGPGYLNVAIRTAAGWFGVDMGVNGPLNIFSWYGLVFLYVLYLVPHVYLTTAAALRNLDPSLEEASRMSGGGAFRTLTRVTLPAIAPAIASGAMLALIFGVAMFSVPFLIGTPAGIEVLPVTIVNLMAATFPPQTGQAVAFGVVLMAFIGIALTAQARLVKAGRQATIGGKASRQSRVALGGWRWPCRAVMVVYLVCTSLLPLLALIVVSLSPFWSAQIQPETFSLENYKAATTSTIGLAFRNSVLLGAVGATVTMLIAAIIVFASRRLNRTVSQSIRTVTKLPAAFSGVVMGVAFIAVFVGPPFNLQGTLVLLLIGYVVTLLPEASLSAEAAMSQIGRDAVEASASCGGSDMRTFRKIALPLMGPGLTAGWVFVFVLMAGEVTMSVLLASTATPVVGFVMIDLFDNGTYPLLAAMGVIITAVSATVVLSVLGYSRSRTPGSAPQ
jgi:iron(III) transport system permease protein